jgi:anaerobic ribonucleoside-triphosphate reductase activating protein
MLLGNFDQSLKRIEIAVANITLGSTVNGPGHRSVLHLQGCTLACPGCFNKHTWDPKAGTLMSVYDVADKLTEDLPFDGITISGGEPLQQIEPLLAFLALYKAEFSPSTTIIMYSGYSKDEIRESQLLVTLLRSLGVDAIICGRYLHQMAKQDRGLVSSANQEVFLLSDYFKVGELDSGPSAIEAIIGEDGEISLSGFPNQTIINNLRRQS